MLKNVFERALVSRALFSKTSISSATFIAMASQVARATFHSTQPTFQRSAILGVRSFSEENDRRRPRSNRGPQVTQPFVMIRGLPWERHNEGDITTLFNPLKPKQIKIMKEANNDKPSGIVFVEFESVEDTQTALRQSRDIVVDGRSVFIKPSTSEELNEAEQVFKGPGKVAAISKLPASISVDEVKQLLPTFNVEHIVIGNGVVFVRMATAEDREKIVQSPISFKGRTVPCYPSNEFDLRKAEANPSKIVKCRGAGASTTEDDIREFFKGSNITRVNITQREGMNGRPAPGDIYVEFASHDDAVNALQLDRQNLGERYLRISMSAARERRRALQPRDQATEQN